ncbi:MAG: DNA-3-methyladenine glycosylase [Clostridia bacterium]|nr:DNA-3-methyladenine glycosylase [Clostridia bacterium]
MNGRDSVKEAERFMAEAAELAREAAEKGDVPVGAVIVKNGLVIGKGRNTREELSDATGHAEINAIRAASASLGNWRLKGCDIYVTMEPCPMCAGAIVSSRIDRVFFGVPDPLSGGFGGKFDIRKLCDTDKPEVTGFCMSETCGKTVRDFFEKRRNEGRRVKRVTREFLSMPADELAPRLLGCRICRKDPDTGEILSGIISETECYMGTDDTACHASKGRTDRNMVMWSKGGTVYVYLCYGLHYMLNIVSGEKGHPEAVLIRGIIPTSGSGLSDRKTRQKSDAGFCEEDVGSLKNAGNGPGKLTKYLKIDRRLNGADVVLSDEIWLEMPDGDSAPEYETLPRVGIDYAADEDRQRLWRFRLI